MEISKRDAVIALVSFVLGLVLGFNLIYVVPNKKQKDNFCMCTGLNNKLCADPQQLKKDYALGISTEYTIPGDAYGRSG